MSKWLCGGERKGGGRGGIFESIIREIAQAAPPSLCLVSIPYNLSLTVFMFYLDGGDIDEPFENDF